MKKFITYLISEKKILLLSLLMATINQVFSLLNPQVFSRIIDGYASHIDDFTKTEFIKGVGILLLVYIGFALVSRTAKAFQDYFVNTISEKVGTRLYAKSVEHVFTLPFSVFENEQSGSILQKMQKARDNVKKLINDMINIGFFSLIGIIFVLIYALSVHWSIALVFTLAIPIIGVTISIIGKRVKKAQEHIVKRSAELAASTTETLQNVGLVKSLGLEHQEIERLNRVNLKILGLEIKKVVILRKLSFISGTMINAISSLIILVSMILVFNTTITLGQFLALWFYGFFVFGPLSQISMLVSSYQETRASLGELENILSKKPEILNYSHLKKIDTLSHIDFDKVSFSYDDTEKVTLNNISLNIKKGDTVAFVGPSGSGKSTLLKLILGLYTPEQGTINYNHISSHQVHPQNLKKHIGYVPQDTQVFAGTIRENLLFVAPDKTDEECLGALEQAQALEIIKRQGKGLDTIIGENGIKLSGGERQRIAIARALLRTPDVLIFDEATSSLDSQTEYEITKTIKEIRKNNPNLIMIIVAHRLSTIEHADTIHVIKKGFLVESGSHEDLLNKKEVYYSLWNQQN
jgi:ATP-binding cassette subfamily B protein